jgi:PIN domain nuclease of toxin-antitoxin system
VTAGLLVDTHILLWVRNAPEALTAGERRAIDSARSRSVSIVTLWEIAILTGVGCIEAEERLLDLPSGYDVLSVSTAHCKLMAKLPLHHRDPFDRMLVAQAQAEHVPLLTRDRALLAYADQATILRFPEA